RSPASSSRRPRTGTRRRSRSTCRRLRARSTRRTTRRPTRSCSRCRSGGGPLHLSSTAAGWIALGAAAAAAVALLIALLHYLTLRRVRGAQRVLLGGGKNDLVDFAVSLQARIDDLHRAVDEVAAGLGRLDRRIDDTVSKTAIVRYDAYENSGGHQSASVAMLDSSRTGVVLSAIQGRDYARIYVKELDRGRASIALSPEELEAVERAMAT